MLFLKWGMKWNSTENSILVQLFAGVDKADGCSTSSKTNAKLVEQIAPIAMHGAGRRSSCLCLRCILQAETQANFFFHLAAQAPSLTALGAVSLVSLLARSSTLGR